MAEPLPLNRFRTITETLETSEQEVYQVPAGASTVVLGAQCANVSGSETTVTFKTRISGTDTELLDEFPLPPNDAVNLVSGKLVLEENAILVASTTTNLSCKLTLSILETSNE